MPRIFREDTTNLKWPRDRKLDRLHSFKGRLYLVGGWVRDCLLGKISKDFDFVVEGDDKVYRQALRVLSELWPPDAEPQSFPQFRTLRWQAKGGVHIDCARPRIEVYRMPGSLPEVSAAKIIEDDLGRRDFTINAMAAGVSQSILGRLIDPFGGRQDLKAKKVQVLHVQSFIDDPTRIFRALRLSSRLGFSLDKETARLLGSALAREALKTISWERKRDELLRLFKEENWASAASVFVRHGIHFGFLPKNIDRKMEIILRPVLPWERLLGLYFWQLIRGEAEEKSLLSSLPWPARDFGLALEQLEILARGRWGPSRKANPLALRAIKRVKPAWHKILIRSKPCFIDGRDLERAGISPEKRGIILNCLMADALAGRLHSRRQAFKKVKSWN